VTRRAPVPPAVLSFGSADFEEPNWVNAQHLMWRLALRHRVLYVNSLGLRAPRASRADLRKVLRRLAAVGRGATRPDPERFLHVLSPFSLPPALSGARARLGPALLAGQLRAALRRLGLERPVTWVFLPSAAPVLERLDVGPVVYHCVDAYEANPGVDPELVRALEDRLLSRAAVVLASSEPLRSRLAQRHPRVVRMENVADIAAYPPPDMPPPEPPDLAVIGRPRVIYAGNLASYKCDLAMLEDAARSRPDIQWVFVGAAGRGEAGLDRSRLADRANVHRLGEKPPGELAAYIHHCDVGLIPFRDTPLTRHSFPMKFFEYLACGRAVVSAPLPSLAAHLREPLVFSYRTPKEFVDAIERAREADTPALRRERRRLAEEHNWERRLAEVEELLADLAPGAGLTHPGPSTCR
jgi:glycosyltransferase involved in cell wall biosynthesis